jgi:hypothetical protein
MEVFSQAVAQWHDFYIMVGTASATLIGLLFIGVTLNIDLIRRTDFADVLHVAALTFNSFFYPIIFAVVFLIPNISPVGLGTPLLAVGSLGLLNMLLQFRRTRGSHRVWGRSAVANRFFLPSVALLAVIAIAVSVMTGATWGFYWLVPAMILLLASGSRNAWDLLIGLRRPDGESTGPLRK